MKTLYRAIALEDFTVKGAELAMKGEVISANYSTKDDLLNRMKERASYTVGIPFRIEEVYIIERDDVKDLGGDK